MINFHLDFHNDFKYIDLSPRQSLLIRRRSSFVKLKNKIVLCNMNRTYKVDHSKCHGYQYVIVFKTINLFTNRFSVILKIKSALNDRR